MGQMKSLGRENEIHEKLGACAGLCIFVFHRETLVLCMPGLVMLALYLYAICMYVCVFLFGPKNVMPYS